MKYILGLILIAILFSCNDLYPDFQAGFDKIKQTIEKQLRKKQPI